MDSEQCALCESKYRLTFHHLIPRTCHRNKWFRKNFSKEDMKQRGIILCRPCHSFIHQNYSEKVLGRQLNTLELLLGEERVQKHIAWAKRRQK